MLKGKRDERERDEMEMVMRGNTGRANAGARPED